MTTNTTIFGELVEAIVSDLGIKLNEPYWMKIPNFNRYECDINTGAVYDKKKKRILKASANALNYCFVRLNGDNAESRSYPVHQIVMMALLQMTPEGWKRFGFTEINHRNSVRNFNCWINLELSTRKDNMSKATTSKTRRRLTIDEVKQLREEYAHIDKNKMDWYIEKSIELGCSMQTIQYNVLGFYNKDIA